MSQIQRIHYKRVCWISCQPWVTSHHCIFRSRSCFRQLSPSSISCYQKPLIHVISFLFWFNFLCKSRKTIVNSVNLGLTMEIKCAISKLYTFLIHPFGQESLEFGCNDDLAKHVHHLLTVLLTGQGPSHRKIDGPFDYILVLAMYVGDSNFYEAIQVSQYCAVDVKVVFHLGFSRRLCFGLFQLFVGNCFLRKLPWAMSW